MCGIVGYIGSRNTVDVLLSGLHELEERGYDSAGVAVQIEDVVECIRLVPVEGSSPSKELSTHSGIGRLKQGSGGIAHTRWATHGSVSKENAHPHTDCTRNVFVVHNGVIENDSKLRKQLLDAGHVFASETDSEIIAHLIEEAWKLDCNETLEHAVRAAVAQLRGTWGLVVMSPSLPGVLVAARHGSPLLLGQGNGEMFIASLEDAFVRYTRRMIVLEEGDVVTVTADGYSLDREEVEVEVQEEENGDAARYPHRMLFEIFEQPEVVLRALNRGGRLRRDLSGAMLGGLDHREAELLALEHLRIFACGTAKHVSDYGRRLLERYGGFQSVQVIPSSEARPEFFPEKTGVLAVSQSGETMDTLLALKRAKHNNHRTFSIVNRVGKAIARETSLGIYTNSGPEKAVASTKVFTAQATVFALLMLWFGRKRDVIEIKEGRDVGRGLLQLSGKIERILRQADRVKQIAERLTAVESMFFLGRDLCAPIAYEGALKIMEVAYIHAQAFPAGELKHGPIAMIEEGFPVVCLITDSVDVADMITAVKEVKTRGAMTIVIAQDGIDVPDGCADELFRIPSAHSIVTPILMNVPLQLLAYYVAVAKGINPDRPRNLAKSVTVK